MVIFLKAQRRGAASRMGDLLGDDPPRLPMTVMRRAHTDRLGRFTPAHPVTVHKHAPEAPHVAFRPDTTQTQHRTGLAALEALAERVIARSGRDRLSDPGGALPLLPRVLGARLFADLQETGHARLIGHTIRDSRDLADLASVYRDPRIETFRAVFVDDSGLVVGESAYSNRLPGGVWFSGHFDDLTTEIVGDHDRFRATGYWLLHNHPSGLAAPSMPDRLLTRDIAQSVRGFRGHIIVDHTSYTVLNASGEGAPVQDERLGRVDFHAVPSMPHPLLSRSISNADDAVQMAAELRRLTPEHPVLILTKGSRAEVDLVMSFPFTLIPTAEQSTAPLKAWMRQLMRTSGAGSGAFLVLPYDDTGEWGLSHPDLKRLVHERVMTDIIGPGHHTMQQIGIFPRGDGPDLTDARRVARRVTSEPLVKAKSISDAHVQDLFGEPSGTLPSTTRVKGHVRSDGTYVREHMRHVQRAKPGVLAPRPIAKTPAVAPTQTRMDLVDAPPESDRLSDQDAWAWVEKAVPDDLQFEVMDRFYDGTTRTKMELMRIARDIKVNNIHARRARAKTELLERHGDTPVGLEVRHPQTDQHAVILPDASHPGRFRASRFDARGFYTHDTRDTAEQVLDELIDDGFTEHAPGALDRLASTPEWAEGMEATWGIQRANARPVEATQRMKVYNWDAVKLSDAYSLQALDKLRRQVEEQHRNPTDTGGHPLEGGQPTIHLYDKAGRKKLDALAWAVRHKLDEQKSHAAAAPSQPTPAMAPPAPPRPLLEASPPIAPAQDAPQKVVRMTMDEWKKTHRNYKGTVNGQRTVMAAGGMYPVEIVKDSAMSSGKRPVDATPAPPAKPQPLPAAIGNAGAFSPSDPNITKAMRMTTPLILFFKAQARGAAAHMGDLFGAAPLVEAVVPVRLSVTKEGRVRRSHLRHTKVRQDEGHVAPIIPSLLDDLEGGDHVRAGDPPAVSIRLGRDHGPENTAEQPYLADGIKLSRGAVTRRPGTDQLPEDLVGSLRPHARDAVNLALEQFQAGYRSFLIADGTGAGKTRQALAIAEVLRRREPAKPVLIVTANRRVIADAFAKDAATMGVPITAVDSAAQMTGGGVYVTTYTRVSRGDFAGAPVGTVMFDEAHNLKNFTSKKTKAGSDLLKAADQSVLLTATPGDKPEHIGYLATAFGFNFQRAMSALGYVKGEYGFELQGGLRLEDALQRLGAFYEDLTAKGLMVKREVSMDNVNVAKHTVTLDASAAEMMAQAHDAMLQDVAVAAPQRRGLTKMLGLNRLRNALEPFKIDATIASVQDRLTAGRKVVVFANRINESELPAWWPAGVESSVGTLDALASELEGRGITVGRLYGKHLNKAGETIAGFQTGTTDVVIATPQAGSTGLNLDDTTGKIPRSMVVMTAPFSSIEAVQMIGRINRLTTKSRADVAFIQAGSVDVDAWNYGIIAAKLAHLGASVQGDVAKLNLDRLEHVSDEDLIALGARNVPVSEGARIDLATLGLKNRSQVEQERQEQAAKEAKARARTDLRVPYDDKDYAKRFGARWDPAKRTWYVTGEVPKELTKYAGGQPAADKPAFVVPNGVTVTRMTADQIRATHEALRCVAGVCNGARTLDGMGFNQMDARLGHALAGAFDLTPEQAAQGRALVYKYKNQIPDSVLQQMGKPSEGTGLDDAAAQAKGAKTAGFKGKRYVIGWQGATKYGHRTKLVETDGREFWVDTNRLEKAMILFFKTHRSE